MYPKYRIDKERGKFLVREFTGFDHSWAEYSAPTASFDTKKEAQIYIGDKLLTETKPTAPTEQKEG